MCIHLDRDRGWGGVGTMHIQMLPHRSLLHCSCLLGHTLLYLRNLVPVVGMVRIIRLQKVELCIPSLIDTYAIFKLQPCTSHILSINTMNLHDFGNSYHCEPQSQQSYQQYLNADVRITTEVEAATNKPCPQEMTSSL